LMMLLNFFVSKPCVSVDGSNGPTYETVYSFSDLLKPSSAAAKMCVSVSSVLPCGRVILVSPLAVNDFVSGPPASVPWHVTRPLCAASVYDPNEIGDTILIADSVPPIVVRHVSLANSNRIAKSANKHSAGSFHGGCGAYNFGAFVTTSPRSQR
jgi:hypothetical protein